MNELKALILGIVQGLTEFLPVSSSGHIEIFKWLLGNNFDGEESIQFTVILHFATALATIYVFRKEISDIVLGLFRKEKSSINFVTYIILSMIPAALVFVLFDDFITSFFDGNILLVGFCLVFTGFLLFVADQSKTTDKGLSWWRAMVVGVAQAIAIFPGVSRSGATISSAVVQGMDREVSARFSFLMVVPLIVGKIILDASDGEFFEGDTELSVLGVGFIAAFITGIIACRWMLKLVKKAQLKYFGIYCLIVGGVLIALNL